MYRNSHALVVGINRYKHTRPLEHAVNDANAVADVLESSFGFNSVIRLLDEDATRERIWTEFTNFLDDASHVDDRLLVYFACHGHTVPRNKNHNDVGYLVPYDGQTHRTGTLLRWDTLTKDAELMNAKHIFFVVDACYGGLAITRAVPSGATRFVKSMLDRRSRQVLTAGKGNEVVSDAGGPRVGHSVFTGHFLDAIEGKANHDGVICATGVMGYVYKNVAHDHDSRQTPHYGLLSGDGDFIFNTHSLPTIEEDGTSSNDRLVSVASYYMPKIEGIMTPVDKVKELLATPENRIRLSDFVIQMIRSVSGELDAENFPLRGDYSAEALAERVQRYDDAIMDLCEVQMLLGKWGDGHHLDTISLAAKRIAERVDDGSGMQRWINLSYYPVVMLIYACGLGAVCNGKFKNFLAVLNERLPHKRRSNETMTVAQLVFGTSMDRQALFKDLPSRERQYCALSEYLFAFLQPIADDILFIGKDYDSLFDKVEMLIALELATAKGGGRLYGRYAWKEHGGHSDRGPLAIFIEDARKQGAKWEPLTAGFFGGSIHDFNEGARVLEENVVRLQWY